MDNCQKEKSDFYRERDEAIYQAFLKCSKNHTGPLDIDKVIDDVMREPQKRIWMPARTVYETICRYASTPPPRSAKPVVHYVLSVFRRIRNRRELRGKPLTFISDFVVAEPSVGFYLSHRRIFDIIRKMRKEKFRERCQSALKGMQSFERHALIYGKQP